MNEQKGNRILFGSLVSGFLLWWILFPVAFNFDLLGEKVVTVTGTLALVVVPLLLIVCSWVCAVHIFFEAGKREGYYWENISFSVLSAGIGLFFIVLGAIALLPFSFGEDNREQQVAEESL